MHNRRKAKSTVIIGLGFVVILTIFIVGTHANDKTKCRKPISCVGLKNCTCEDGYLLEKRRVCCKASCINVGEGGPQGCGDNAFCVAPDKCKCHMGYQKNFNSSSPICVPVCNPPCGPNTFCQSPNKCICDSIFTRDDEEDENNNDDSDSNDDDDDDVTVDTDSLWMELEYEILGGIIGSLFGGTLRKFCRRYVCCCCCKCCCKKKEPAVTAV